MQQSYWRAWTCIEKLRIWVQDASSLRCWWFWGLRHGRMHCSYRTGVQKECTCGKAAVLEWVAHVYLKGILVLFLGDTGSDIFHFRVVHSSATSGAKDFGVLYGAHCWRQRWYPVCCSQRWHSPLLFLAIFTHLKYPNLSVVFHEFILYFFFIFALLYYSR